LIVYQTLGERRNINQVPTAAKWIDCIPRIEIRFRGKLKRPHKVATLADNFLRPYRGYGTSI